MKRLKQHTSMPGLLKRARAVFDKILDTTVRRSQISLADCLLSGVAFERFFGKIKENKRLALRFEKKLFIHGSFGLRIYVVANVNCKQPLV